MPTPFQGRFPDGAQQFAMNPNEFDRLIKGHGIRMVHARPIPCPNIRDLYAGDHDPACERCYNGMIYYGQKEFVGYFGSNNNARQFNIQGTWDLDQAVIVVPTHYNDGTELDVQFFDQVLIPDFTVRYYQRVEHSQMGTDRLHFPATSLDKVIDATGKEFRPGVDVIVDGEGRLKWIGDRPGYDLAINKGMIYSVNYYCKPVFTVIGLPHQLRASQTLENGKAIQARFPQQVIVRKDFVPFNSGDKTGPPDSSEPRDGQL